MTTPVSVLTNAKPLTAENFAFVRDLLLREAAIVLEAGKEYLIETRLAAVAARHHHASVNGLIELLRCGGPARPSLQLEILDAMTTNETMFFRDVHPFDALRAEIFPRLRTARANEKRLRIWSAACSTGQEAYSLAMVLAHHFPDLADWDIQIVGTDLSPSVVRRARNGIFQQIEVNRGLPAPMLVKYFRQQPDGWHVDPVLSRRTEFREINLARLWSHLPRFDLVLLRNVLIYFDTETRQDILRRLRQQLQPDGFLLLGGSESALATSSGYSMCPVGRTTFFQAGTADGANGSARANGHANGPGRNGTG